MMYKEYVMRDMMIQFLERLIRTSNRKTFLIFDNLKVHHANKLRKWVKAHSALVVKVP